MNVIRRVSGAWNPTRAAARDVRSVLATSGDTPTIDTPARVAGLHRDVTADGAIDTIEVAHRVVWLITASWCCPRSTTGRREGHAERSARSRVRAGHDGHGVGSPGAERDHRP